MSDMTERAVVVGGGLAGLAAAAALAQRGIGVTVLESRPRLGGRASSFVDKASGTLRRIGLKVRIGSPSAISFAMQSPQGEGASHRDIQPPMRRHRPAVSGSQQHRGHR